MNIISGSTKHSFKSDAFSVVRAFRFLRNQNFFKLIDKKHYVIWTDCGTHFRSKEAFAYFLKELPSEGLTVDLNFFAEKHGIYFRYFLQYLYTVFITVFIHGIYSRYSPIQNYNYLIKSVIKKL